MGDGPIEDDAARDDDQDPIDEAMAGVMTASGKEEEDEAISELMAAVAGADELTQQEAVEITASKTRKTKKEAKALLKEAASNRSKDLIEINKIEKIIPPGDADATRYRFYVDIRGENGVIELDSDDLLTGRVFRRQVFELADRLVEFPEWDETLNSWLDTTEITEREEAPLSPEHAVAESVIGRIRSMEFSEDYDEFRMNPRIVAHHDPGDGTVKVAGMVIDDVRQGASGDIAMRKIRSILSEFLTGTSQQVRYDDQDGKFRVWTFDAEALTEKGGVKDLAGDGGESRGVAD